MMATRTVKNVYLKAWSFFIVQPGVSSFGVIPVIGRSQNVSIAVEMRRPTDKKKMKVGKENKIQNDLFGTLRHDLSDAFPDEVSECD
jgi:hypothetical protein